MDRLLPFLPCLALSRGQEFCHGGISFYVSTAVKSVLEKLRKPLEDGLGATRCAGLSVPAPPLAMSVGSPAARTLACLCLVVLDKFAKMPDVPEGACASV